MAKEERSAGFVIYFDGAPDSLSPEKIEYLLLDYGRHWDFVKGHVEPGENDMQTAIRELREETSITGAHVVSGFERAVTYFFRHKKNGLVKKTVVFFLARTNDRKIILSAEHQGYAFVPFEQAMKRLTFPTAQQTLRDAHQHVLATRSSENPAT